MLCFPNKGFVSFSSWKKK